MSSGFEVEEAFRRRFRREPRRALAPGRVNLIGEHTDYNDGFVLPVAIDRSVELAFSASSQRALRGVSMSLDREGVVLLNELAPVSRPSWLDYAAGVAWALRAAGLEVPGMDFVVGGDLPMGAGLSSSAAFELAVARALYALADAPWHAGRAAELAQRAEKDYVGMPCGIMDQMAVALAEPGAAMLLDCRSLDHESVPLPGGWRVVVMDTGTRRRLATSAYEERRRACERAAAALGVPALRDASRDRLEGARERLDETAFRRALHVVEENERTLEMAAALGAEDGGRVGALMAASHASLRDLYEVSTDALDLMVALAARQPGCVGARMTGAGFGGSAVALVEATEVERFMAEVASGFRRATPEEPSLFVCRAAAGAALAR